MIRLIFALVVAAFEATAVSLPLAALTTAAPPWHLMLAVVVVGWAADLVTLRLPAPAERPALLVGAVLAAAVLIGPALGSGSPGALLALLPGGERTVQAYFLLLLALFLYWRGTRLDTRDSAAIGALFGRGATAGLAGLFLGAISGTGLPLGSPAILAQIAALIGLGLLALALAHAQETAGGRLQGLGWRWLGTLLAAIGVVLALAVAATGLLGGGEATAAAQNLLRIVMLPFAIVGGAIAFALYALLAEPLLAALRAILAQFQGFQLAPMDEVLAEREGGGAATELIVRAANSATFLLALIPIVILILAILLLRRRARTRPVAEEERESLDLLASLAGDLRDLLAGLRNPFARALTGLRAALAALAGDDPTTRARRAYVRLLLLLEGRERSRAPAQTPAEFAPIAAQAAGAPEAVARLTAAYERARYSPGGTDEADAARAEAALQEIERP